MISEAEVRAVLNRIIDPCSRAAGCPAGLDEMGLVRAVDLTPSESGTHVRVVIAVTEYGCLMGAPFAMEARQRLSALGSIASVCVELDDRFDWDLDDLSPTYRERLARHRRMRGIGVAVIAERAIGSRRDESSG
jgi:metal-sulfur cluster biosynthetic enzyme